MTPSEADDSSSREGDQTDHATADCGARILVQNHERVQVAAANGAGPFEA